MNPNLAAFASAGGHAKAARAQAEERSILEAVLPDDLRLTSEDDAQRLLALATDLCLRGLLMPARAGAIAKTVDGWLRAEAQKLDRVALVAAQAEIAKLRAEIRTMRQSRSAA